MEIERDKVPISGSVFGDGVPKGAEYLVECLVEGEPKRWWCDDLIGAVRRVNLMTLKGYEPEVFRVSECGDV